MVASFVVAARCLLLGAACLPQRAPRLGGAVMAVPAGYLVRTLKPTQTIGLLASWEKHSKVRERAGRADRRRRRALVGWPTPTLRLRRHMLVATRRGRARA